MEPDAQALIEVAMERAGIPYGVGHMSKLDVQQHLQLTALEAARRYDDSVKFTTYLWPRINGECMELLRTHGTRLRHSGRLRLDHPDNQTYLSANVPTGCVVSTTASAVMADANYVGEAGDWIEDDEDEFEGVCEMADLTLALGRLPDRLRVTLYLIYFEHLTLQEAADRLRTTADALREMRDTALLKMRAYLATALSTNDAH